MKTIILIKENRVQLILEPEQDHDNQVLKILEKLPNAYRTHFYDCQGGWTRVERGQEDLIVVFDMAQKNGRE